MVVEEHEYGEYDNGHNDEPFKHIAQQDEHTGYGQQKVPWDMDRG